MKNRHEYEAELRDKAMVNAEFRAKLIEDPRGTIADHYGVDLAEGIRFEVVEETSDTVYLVLPQSEELSVSELETVAGGVQMGTLVNWKQNNNNTKNHKKDSK